MKNKKLLAMLCVTLLLVCCMATPAFAATSTTVTSRLERSESNAMPAAITLFMTAAPR